jgi:hypothetical protein
MHRSDPSLSKRVIRLVLVLAAVVTLGGVLLGLGDMVSAALDPPKPMQPYDPMPNW